MYVYSEKDHRCDRHPTQIREVLYFDFRSILACNQERQKQLSFKNRFCLETEIGSGVLEIFILAEIIHACTD